MNKPICSSLSLVWLPLEVRASVSFTSNDTLPPFPSSVGAVLVAFVVVVLVFSVSALPFPSSCIAFTRGKQNCCD